MTETQHTTHAKQPPPLEHKDAKDVAKTDTPTPPTPSPWAAKISDVINSLHVPISAAGVGPVTPVFGAVERSIWGSAVDDSHIPPPPEALAARKEYNAKIADLEKQIDQIRIDKGADDPEYMEAHRLLAIALR